MSNCGNCSSPLSPGAQKWRRDLLDFVAPIERPRPKREQLSPLQHEHRRVTGGVLHQFFQFLEDSADEERFPALQDHPLPQRLFVLVTDEAGVHATEDLMDTSSEQAVCLLKEEWRAFLESDDTDHDDAFEHHYEFWSVWHRNMPDQWDFPQLGPGQSYWIHEEGFALTDGVGRGAQHLWRWDGEEFELVDEMTTAWSS